MLTGGHLEHCLMQVGVKLLVGGVKLLNVLRLETLQEQTVRSFYPLKYLGTLQKNCLSLLSRVRANSRTKA